MNDKDQNFSAIVLIFLFIVGIITFIIMIVFAPPPKPREPLKINIPRAEKVGEAVGDKATRFGKGVGKGIWKNINPFYKKEKDGETIQTEN